MIYVTEQPHNSVLKIQLYTCNTVHSSVTPRYAVDVDQDTLKEAVKEVADMFLADVIRSSSTPPF